MSPRFCVNVEILRGISKVSMKINILEIFSKYSNQTGMSFQNISG
jgi:hypothetical protein